MDRDARSTVHADWHEQSEVVRGIRRVDEETGSATDEGERHTDVRKPGAPGKAGVVRRRAGAVRRGRGGLLPV
jgi:hypothetical protein